MTILFMGLWGLLILKLVWNIFVPVVIQKREYQAPERKRGISMMMFVEWLLALVLLGISAVWRGPHWYDAPGSVAVVGFGSILVSYVLMFVTGTVTRIVMNRLGRRWG